MKYIFSGDLKYRDGETKLLAIICDGTCIVFDGEMKFSTGKQRKQGGESAENSNVAGKRLFLADHLLPWRGSASAGSLLEGV